MNRKTAFARICDKIDRDRQTVAEMISCAVPGKEFFFGMYCLVYNMTDETCGKKLYLLSLYKKKTLETRVLVDID